MKTQDIEEILAAQDRELARLHDELREHGAQELLIAEDMLEELTQLGETPAPACIPTHHAIRI